MTSNKIDNANDTSAKDNTAVGESKGEIPECDERIIACGYGSCTPEALQKCNNAKVFLAVICLFCTVQGFVVNGINNVNTSTLERRYQLPSSRVGLISSAYDISAGILVIPITYWGAHAHKPRLLAFAALCLALGSFVMCIPQIASGQYQLGNAVSDVCLAGSNATDNGCGDIEESLALQNYLYVFMLGQFLHGIGGTTLYSIGIVFIDENVKTKVSALYIGIMYAFSAVGPALGYVAGGQFLNIYVDAAVTNSADISITNEDPRWVGAWWLGFAIGCCGFVVVAAMLFCYGYELPDAKEAKTERYSQAHQDGSEDVANRDGFGKSIKDLPLSTKLILLNPTFMFINLAGCTEGLIISGFATFMPKFIQNQFWQTAGMSAFYGGLVAVIGAAGGQALGGFIAKRFNLKVKGMLKLSMGCCIACVAFVLIFLARCDSEKIGGITVSYINKTEIEESALIADCNRGCNCTSESYEPICGIDGIAYFTPCHAGCLRSFKDGSTKRYANCSCIDTPAESPYSATSGKCEPTCNLLAVFLPIFFIVVTLTFMVSPIGMSASLRVIPDAQRSYSVGIKWVIMRFLGTVPGPILFGAIFDIACRQWQEKCDERGSCWIYDNNSLSLNLLLLGLVIKIISAIFFFVAYLLYKPPSVDVPISLLDKRGKTISENVNNINTTDTK